MSEAISTWVGGPVSIFEWTALVIVLVLIFLPPKNDPAVRMRQWQLRKLEREREARASAKDRS